MKKVRTLHQVKSAVIFTVFCGFATSLGAQHGAHQHGVAELTLALEGDSVEIALNSPAISIVGFEYQAATDDQAQAVEDAREKLLKIDTLFSFEGSQCELESSSVDMSPVERAADDHTEEHESHDHHDDHDKHEKEHHHDHDEDHHDHGEETHSDIAAEYKFSCEDAEALAAVVFGSGSLPFAFEVVQVMWVTEDSQGAVELRSGNQRIELK